VVGTYSHDIRAIDAAMPANELSLFKFYMIQARPPTCTLHQLHVPSCCAHVCLHRMSTIWSTMNCKRFSGFRL
jgi:hypothetical protein